jgi:anti-sigma factor RsiW
LPAITLDLQEGFAGETVEVRLDGREVWRGEVRTDWSIGLAERVQVEVPAGGGTVSVTVPSRPASIDLVLKPGEAPVLGVSLIGGGLVSRRSDEPFRYF